MDIWVRQLWSRLVNARIIFPILRDNVAIVLGFDNRLRRDGVFSAPVDQASFAVGRHAGEVTSCLYDGEYRSGGN